ncbi:branched-chain amino acid ABC transporter substrate-binding protein [Massilia sp. IC2-477]|uniref:branched-chain amino acid ABC transporter substrate-binding protein n=1 Tax=Massilia sp. IC2-477 TaxID=2887198 RepID=UPI001D12FD65|nr:branched-chain amino acid ABC transporter substrate-binding protein [Massilia sp. IC2-477]MCC2958377.1 branched-chain amino acid ABC transporter substrate-binding protein [Massilia sp. IC2-477]
MRPAAVCSALVSSLLLAAPAGAQTIVKIGTASPLSGPGAHQGKDIEDGARMAIDELNAKGIAIGGKKIKWVLQAEDDASDPKTGTMVAQKLVDARVAAVVGHLNSGPTVPASKIYASAGIPQISPAATTPVYTAQGYKTAFRVVANDALIGRTLARHALGALGAKRIAVIDDRTAFGQGLADQFAREVRAKGATIVSRQFTHDKATDFSAILTQIRGHKPDIVFYGGMDAVAGPMLKQMKTLGLQARFVAGDGVCSEKLPLLAGDALGDDKVFCAVAGGVTGAQEAAFNAFGERFRQRYGHPVETYAPYAYDAVMVFAAAMQKAGSSEPARFLPALAGVKHEGVTGSIAFDPKGDLRNAAMTLYTYRQGKKVKLQVVRGT